MKKKYLSPEIEELLVDAPVLLAGSEDCTDVTEGGDDVVCTTETLCTGQEVE